MAVGGSLDGRAAGRGALVTLVVALPPIILVRVLKGNDLSGEESNLWVVALLALLAGFTLGGHAAARVRPTTPFVHAAAAAGLAWAALALYTVARLVVTGEGVDVALVVRLLLVGQIGASLAILGGYVAFRAQRRSAETEPVSPPAPPSEPAP